MSKANPKNDARHAKIDLKILVEIDRIRSEFKACSVRMLSSQMRLSETAVRGRVHRMRGELLEWCETKAGVVPGSVHLLPAGQERVDAWKAENAPTDSEGLPTGEAVTAPSGEAEVSVDLTDVDPELVARVTAAVVAALTPASTTEIADQEPAADHEDPTSPEE